MARGVSRMASLTVTSGSGVESLTEAVSYDASAALYNGSRINGPTAGAWTLVAVMPSRLDYTDRVRIGGSACEMTSWVSESATNCKTPRGGAGGVGTRAFVVTTGSLFGSMPEALTYDAVQLTSGVAANNGFPTDGEFVVQVYGSGFGNTFTVSARLGGTACEETAWASATSIECKRDQGVAGTRRVAVTAGQRPGTITHALSYNAPLIQANAEILVPVAGNTNFTLGAASNVTGMGVADYTAGVRFGATGCESSVWLSDTQVPLPPCPPAPPSRTFRIDSIPP